MYRYIWLLRNHETKIDVEKYKKRNCFCALHFIWKISIGTLDDLPWIGSGNVHKKEIKLNVLKIVACLHKKSNNEITKE